MNKYTVINIENIEELVLAIDDAISEKELEFVDKYTDLSVLSNISRLHELVFKGKVWGVLELNEREEVLDFFLIELPGEIYPNLTYCTALIWYGTSTNLFDYMVKSLSKEYGNTIKKIKFKVISDCNFNDYNLNLLNKLKKELEIKAGNRIMSTYVYYL